MISEICSEFVRMGFKNIIVLLGHAGTDNKAALKNTLQMLLRRDEELAKKLHFHLLNVGIYLRRGLLVLQWSLNMTFMLV